MDRAGTSTGARALAAGVLTCLCAVGLAAGGRAAPAVVPEIGANDFRISQAGAASDAKHPSVAYNPVADEYLVVWEAETAVNDEFEVYGQRLSSTGVEVGANDFRISDMGPEGDTAFSAANPVAVYNPDAGEYLVVWQGVDTANDGLEIYGQRLSATGAELGTNDFRISDMGVAGGNDQEVDPAVAYNATSHEYIVVWSGTDSANMALDPAEPEIYGQRLDAAGAEVGADDFRISSVGPDGDSNYHAATPAVAWDSTANQYLVVWNGDEIDDDNEIYGQRLSAAGAEVGVDDFEISVSGPVGDISWIGALHPSVAYNATSHEFLVVWDGDHDVLGDVDIRGQRLSSAGAEVGTDDFPISSMDFATTPAVVWTGAGTNQYVVVWEGTDTGQVMNEVEIFGQRLTAAGAQVGPDDFRLSDMGPDGNANYGALDPAVAQNSTTGEHLAVWWGDDNTAPLVDNDFEVFGQRFNDATTAVRLVRLSARPVAGGVELRWRTASELGVLGFNLWRRAGGAPLVRANPVLLPARAVGSGGASYRWLDRSARAPGRYGYRLEAVGLDGTRRPVGAVTVVRRP